MTIRRLVLLLCVQTGILFAQTNGIPRNIIIMIGDGMGIGQVTAGRTLKGSLALDKFKTVGLLLTHAAGKDYITDSAAGATALSTGVKTYNGAIGVNPDTVAVENVLERGKKKGKRTGVVVACSITHATPASFVAHVPLRGMQLEIAEQISRGVTDVFLGGGWGWFLPDSMGGRRKDGKNLISLMQKSGYKYVSKEGEFRNLRQHSGKILGLFAENQLDSAQARRPSLREMTATALKILSQSDSGFVLMVEGSQIDWASHDHKTNQIMVEMADFDDAIEEVVAFAGKDRQTLVIVTADHETGGFALAGGSLETKEVTGKFTTTGHSAAMVPLFASGPGSAQFAGIQQNSNVGSILLRLLRE
jgi:alkaline phosphatase